MLPKFELIPELFGDAVVIAIVAYVISMSLGRLFSAKHDYVIDANKVSDFWLL